MTSALSFLTGGPAFSGEIHEAAEGDLEAVKRLLEKDPGLIESQDDMKQTPLHIAAYYGAKEVVAYLLTKGAEVNARCYNRFTPLHLTWDPEIAKLLLEHGADLKLKAATGTPLEDAVGSENLALIQVFLDAGEKLDFDLLLKLDRTRDVLDMLKEKPWLAKPPRNCLSTAVWNGNMELVVALLKCGADPNFSPDSMFRSAKVTALSSAIMKSNYEITKLLFEHGARPDAGAYIGKTDVSLVHYTVRMDDIRFLKLVLEHGGELNVWSDLGNMTPLHVAAQGDGLEKVKLLLKYKANVNADPGDGVTPLFCAALNGTAEMCDFLLSEGARLDFYSACVLGKKAEVEAMLKATPTLATTKDKRLKREPVFYAAMGGREEIARLLIEKGADVNARGPEFSEGNFIVYLGSSAWAKNIGETPLHTASKRGFVEFVRILLDKGAKTTAKDNNGDTPLHVAAKKGERKVVKLLLDRNADVNATSRYGGTPLSVAAYSDIELVRLLLKARPSKRTLNGALAVAAAYHDEQQGEIAKLLMENGAEADLNTACTLGLVKRAEALLKANPSLANSSSDQNPPLYEAAGNGHVELVDLLIKKGARIRGSEGYRPLFAAVERGHLPVVKQLVAAGADIEARDYRGSPLFFAAENNHVAVADYLLNQKAKLMSVDAYRNTALHKAAEAEALEMIRFLVQKGIGVNVKNNYGSTPLHEAASSGRSKAVALLLKLGADHKFKNFQGKTPLDVAEKRGFYSFDEEKRDKEGVLKILRELDKAIKESGDK